MALLWSVLYIPSCGALAHMYVLLVLLGMYQLANFPTPWRCGSPPVVRGLELLSVPSALAGEIPFCILHMYMSFSLSQSRPRAGPNRVHLSPVHNAVSDCSAVFLAVCV